MKFKRESVRRIKKKELGEKAAQLSYSNILVFLTAKRRNKGKNFWRYGQKPLLRYSFHH